MATSFNFGNLFRNTQQVALAPTQQQQQPPQQQPPGTPGSTMQQRPGQQAQPGQSAQQQPSAGGSQQSSGQNSSLDAFADLWKTDPTKTPNPASQDPWADPLFATDPSKIREAASKMDFLGQVPQDLMQKAMSGNDPQAFMQVINAVGQNTLAAALQIGTATTEHAGKQIGERFNKSLPGRFKDMQIEGTQPSDPRLQHPAVQPMLKFARNQVKQMNPDASPQEIQAKAEEYILAMMSGGDSGDGGGSSATGNSQDNFNWGGWVQSQAAPNP